MIVTLYFTPNGWTAWTEVGGICWTACRHQSQDEAIEVLKAVIIWRDGFAEETSERRVVDEPNL